MQTFEFHSSVFNAKLPVHLRRPQMAISLTALGLNAYSKP